MLQRKAYPFSTDLTKKNTSWSNLLFTWNEKQVLPTSIIRRSRGGVRRVYLLIIKVSSRVTLATFKHYIFNVPYMRALLKQVHIRQVPKAVAILHSIGYYSTAALFKRSYFTDWTFITCSCIVFWARKNCSFVHSFVLSTNHVIVVGGHFVSLLRKFTSFWCKNLGSFSREDTRSICFYLLLKCRPQFLICDYCY